MNFCSSLGEARQIILHGYVNVNSKCVRSCGYCLRDLDVVWGSRLMGRIEKGAMSKTNRLGNMILSFAASSLFFKRTTDLCTGYWGFKLNKLRNLHLTATGFTLEADIFCSVVKSRFRTKEIPIDYALREGESSLKWYKDGPRILGMAIKRRFSGS